MILNPFSATTLPQRILASIVICVALLTIGFGSGFYTKGKFDKADKVDEVMGVVKDQQKARAGDAENVADSQQKSAELDRKVGAGDAQADTIKKEIKKYEPRADVRPNPVSPETGVSIPGQQSVCPPSFAFLSRGELWLLDSVRLGQPGTPDLAPFKSDDEGRAPSDVARSELLEADVEAVKRYNALKDVHNGLVDYVEWLQAEQRKRLGASEQ